MCKHCGSYRRYKVGEKKALSYCPRRTYRSKRKGGRKGKCSVCNGLIRLTFVTRVKRPDSSWNELSSHPSFQRSQCP